MWSFWLGGAQECFGQGPKRLTVRFISRINDKSDRIISYIIYDQRGCLMMYLCPGVEGEINERVHACVWYFIELTSLVYTLQCVSNHIISYLEWSYIAVSTSEFRCRNMYSYVLACVKRVIYNCR